MFFRKLESRGLVRRGKFPTGQMLTLEFLKDPSWLFLIYNAKLFADDTSLFSVTHDINKSANKLNNDLAKISN